MGLDSHCLQALDVVDFSRRMFFLLSTAGVLVFGLWAARWVTEWLANQPDTRLEHDPDEVLTEMETAFVEREALSFMLDRDSVPVLLQRLTEAVGLGFSAKQATALAYRIRNQHVNDFYHAAYPVEVKGVSSDIDFQWCREDERTVRMALCAVPEVIQFAAESIRDLVIENQAEP